MEPRDLNPDERAVLLGLVAHMINADGITSTEELEGLRSLAVAFGLPAFQTSLAETRGSTIGEMMDAAALVEGQEARRLIRDQVRAIAAADGLHEAEESILEALDEVWGSWTRD